MQCISATDDELWRAIADNTNQMSALVEKRPELDAEFAAVSDPKRRAQLMQAHLDLINKMQREYRECTTELRRRYLTDQGHQQGVIEESARKILGPLLKPAPQTQRVGTARAARD